MGNVVLPTNPGLSFWDAWPLVILLSLMAVTMVVMIVTHARGKAPRVQRLSMRLALVFAVLALAVTVPTVNHLFGPREAYTDAVVEAFSDQIGATVSLSTVDVKPGEFSPYLTGRAHQVITLGFADAGERVCTVDVLSETATETELSVACFTDAPTPVPTIGGQK